MFPTCKITNLHNIFCEELSWDEWKGTLLHSLLYSSSLIEQITNVASMIVYIMLPNFTYHISIQSTYYQHVLKCITCPFLHVAKLCMLYISLVGYQMWGFLCILMNSSTIPPWSAVEIVLCTELVAQTIHLYMSKVIGWAHMPTNNNGRKVFMMTTTSIV